MPGEITYTPTEADYVAAQRTAFARSLWRWPVMRVWLVVFAIASASGIWASWHERASAIRVLIVAGFMVWGAVMMPLCWALSYLLLPTRARRLFRQQRSLSKPWRYRWSEAVLENAGESGAVRLPWEDFHAWTRGSHTFLFYLNDVLFHFLPIRTLTNEQASEIEQLLTDRQVTRR